MDEITVRKATADDLEALLLFEQGVINAERPYDDTIKTGDILYYNMQHLLTAANIFLVIAEIYGQPVGCGYTRIDPARHFVQHTHHAYLGFMYVLPQHRGKGVNKKVIEALKQWAKAQNLTEMQLEVYHNNTAAVKAYEKAGFSSHISQMRMGI